MAETKRARRRAEPEPLAAARAKRDRGQALTSRERDAIRKADREAEQAARLAVLARIPKADYVAASGKTYKSLTEFAARYEVPELRGRTVDVAAMLRRLHELVQELQAQLAAAGTNIDADPDPLHRLRERHIARADLELAARRGELIDREQVRDALDDGALILRRAAERLQRRFGDDAARIYLDALDRVEERFAERFAEEAEAFEESLF